MEDSNRVEQLLASLRDDNEALRNHAATNLSQIGEVAVPKFINLFLEDDLVVREAAASAAGPNWGTRGRSSDRSVSRG